MVYLSDAELSDGRRPTKKGKKREISDDTSSDSDGAKKGMSLHSKSKISKRNNFINDEAQVDTDDNTQIQSLFASIAKLHLLQQMACISMKDHISICPMHVLIVLKGFNFPSNLLPTW